MVVAERQSFEYHAAGCGTERQNGGATEHRNGRAPKMAELQSGRTTSPAAECWRASRTITRQATGHPSRRTERQTAEHQTAEHQTAEHQTAEHQGGLSR